MEINPCTAALILIVLLLAYLSISETRCFKCGSWLAIYAVEKKPRAFVYKCRKCQYQWTQASRKLTPLGLLSEYLEEVPLNISKSAKKLPADQPSTLLRNCVIIYSILAAVTIFWMPLFGALQLSDNAFNLGAALIPAIFVVVTILVDSLMLVSTRSDKIGCLTSRLLRTYTIAVIIGSLASGFWSFGYLQYASHGYGEQILQHISTVVMLMSLVIIPLSIVVARRAKCDI